MNSLFNILILIFPFVTTFILYKVGFETDIQKTLELFVPFIWSLMVALGGGVIFLKKFAYKNQGIRRGFLEATSEYIKSLSLILIFQTLLFLFLAILFPARGSLRDIVLKVSSSNLIDSAKHAYLSALYSFIFVPSFGAVVVGSWCLLLALNEKTSSNN